MTALDQIYATSLATLTDLYQLTMAYGYWRSETVRHHEALFNLYFRRPPFGGGYTVACGIRRALAYLERFRFRQDDLAYLAGLRGNDGRPLFEPAFLEYLGELRLEVDVDGVAEGTVVFPHEPLLRVEGPLIQCQLLETPLLNIVNFETLIATKAARIVTAARGGPVLEFGLRRAQGIDGALAASYAAYLGGCAGTSNVLAGKIFGIPVKGTHAHSWVMSFESELEAFYEYARAMPNNCVFLVDTYDTLKGVEHAIEVGRWLRSQGYEMVGIRLDSGDLAYLSIEARRMLDAAGFPKAAIVASNDLDDHLIESLLQQGAKIALWGVGTRLATAYEQPALGGVYKMSAIRAPGEPWRYKIKLSEQVIKTSHPGRLQVRRFLGEEGFVADAIYDELTGLSDPPVIVDPTDFTRRRAVDPEQPFVDLLQPLVRAGAVVAPVETLEDARQRRADQLDQLHPAIRRLLNPHAYPAGLDLSLHELRARMILEARGLPS